MEKIKTRFFSFAVTPDELEEIKREAYLNRLSKSEYVRRVVFNKKKVPFPKEK